MTQTMSTLLYEVYQYAHPEEPKSLGTHKDVVIEIVCEHYKTPLHMLQMRSRRKPLPQIRQVLVYMLRKYTKESLSAISRLFYQDHTTAIHNVQTVNDLMSVDKEYKAELGIIESKIRRRQNMINQQL